MNGNFLRCVLLSLLILAIFPNNAKAQDQSKQVILPAGTLLRCTLNEPNLSSKTAEVGDPVVCPLGGILCLSAPCFRAGPIWAGTWRRTKSRDVSSAKVT